MVGVVAGFSTGRGLASSTGRAIRARESTSVDFAGMLGHADWDLDLVFSNFGIGSGQSQIM